MEKRPNIILISIDTLRADHLSCYGYRRETSPFLDRLANEGAVFSNCYSTAGWTPPAHASMLTGLYPSQHGAVDNNRLHDSVPRLAEMLKSAGYATAGFVNNSQVGKLVGLDRGHETFHEIWKGGESRSIHKRGLRFLRRKYLDMRGANDQGARRTNGLVFDWLGSHAAAGALKPFYLFIHYNDVHNPLNAPYPFKFKYMDRKTGADMKKVWLAAENPLICFTDDIGLGDGEIEALKALYDGEISYVDSRIGELVQRLKDLGAYEDTLIMITADHGEHFGEHGLYSHVWSLYEPVVRIPLIVKYPRGFMGGAVHKCLVQLVDIVPTAASLAGLQHPGLKGLPGKTFIPPGGRPEGHEFVVSEWEGRIPFYIQKRLREKGSDDPCGRFLEPFCMIRDERFKYIHRTKGAHELYDLHRDPGERDNVIEREKAVAESLRGKLEGWQGKVSGRAPEKVKVSLDQETLRNLESLGYM